MTKPDDFINLESIDAPACKRLRDLIVSKRDSKGNILPGGAAPFSTHLPESRLQAWIDLEFDKGEIDALISKMAHSLAAKYQAEEARHEKKHPAEVA